MATNLADGTDSLVDGRRATDANEEPKYGDPEDPAASKLLTETPRKAAQINYQLWRDQPKGLVSRRRAQWQVNVWRRSGRSNVYVQKTQDQDRWQAWAPPWTAPPVPVLNKADRLCRRLKSMVFADPPEPQAVPATGDDEDIEAAEFAERVLRDIQSELDDTRQAARAFDRASSYGSGFIRYYLDSHGKREPVRIMAKPGAVSADTPFTGPQGEPLEGEPVARFTKDDGTLTDDPAKAALRWVPKLRSEIVGAPNLRFLPFDAEDLWDCEGIVIATMPTWGELQSLWPDEMAAISEADEQSVVAFKPEESKDLLGFGAERNADEKAKRKEDRRVACFTTYYKACAAYPSGCYFVGLGDCVTLHRQPWTGDVGGKPETLDIPVTQYGQFEMGERNPYFVGLMELLGGGSEIRAGQVGHLMQYLDQFARRKTFIPTNSILQPKSYQLLEGSTIPINPGGKPEFEDIPPYPADSLNLFALMTEEMDDQSMLKQTAQGTEVSSVQSGRQAQVIVAQAKAGLSDIQQNTERAYLRACRIQLQLVRTGYSVPQQISWMGDDGQYRQRYWSGSDLGSTKDVVLKQGSLTLMSDQEKATGILQFAQAGVYQNPDEIREGIVSSLGPELGLEEDPFRKRMKRQLSMWSEGPPKGWAPPQAPVDPTTGMPLMDPATGQPAPPPPDPQLASIFAPLPADELQDVATVRLAELKRFMASTRYSRWPQPWRLGVDQEFAHMKLCAGVMTIPEQQQAQQQAQQQQVDQQAQAADKDFQQKLQLEEAKSPEIDAKILRDPTGRVAGLKAKRNGRNGNGKAPADAPSPIGG